MVLKLKVRHALGEQTLTFTASQSSEPKVVGRARGCDVVVPSMRVLPRHCAIFFHEPTRRWLLQDGNTRGGTSLNGVPLESARRAYALGQADVIALGDDPTPPTLVVEEIAEEPMPVATATPFADSTPPQAFEASVESLDALAQAAARRRRLPRRRNSWGTLVGALLAAGAVAGGTYGLWVWRAQRATAPRTVVVQQEPTIVEVPEPSVDASPIVEGPVAVDVVPDPDVPSPAERRAASTDPAGYEGIVAGLSPGDPLRARPEWEAVVAARRDESVARRLQAYQQFREVPAELTGPLGDVVGSWIEAELDALWWRRIAALLDEEFVLTDLALETEAELRRLDRSPADAERLRGDLAAARERLESISYMLAETLAYAELEAPDPADAEQLARLRARRDREAYEVWRREVLRQSLADATLPWDGNG